MKKLIYACFCALLCSLSAMAEEITVKLIDNKWDGGENAQGYTAITPDKEILAGDQVTISFEGTTAAPDGSLSFIIVDTVSDDFGETQWLVLTGYNNSATVQGGKIAGNLKFTAANKVEKPCICFFTASEGYESYFDVELALSVTCNAVTPKAPEAGDVLELNMDEISILWHNTGCGDYEYNKETQEATLCAWEAAAGWAFWTWSLTSGNLNLAWADELGETIYGGFTIEFEEPLPCQVGLVVQTDDGTDNGENNQIFADAGATFISMNFEEEFIGTPDIRGMWLQFGETTTIKLKRAYLTYGSMSTAAETISANVQFENGVVYSEGQIFVYDVDGKKVAESYNQYNTNYLSAGFYFVQTAEGSMKFFKK